jgi:hypothetical protein
MNDFLLFVLSVFVIVSAKWTIGLGINPEFSLSPPDFILTR